MGKAAKMIAAAKELQLDVKWWKEVKPSSLKKTGVSEAIRDYDKVKQAAAKTKTLDERIDSQMAIIASLKDLMPPLRKAQAGLKKMNNQGPLLKLVELTLAKIYAEKHPDILEAKVAIHRECFVPKSLSAGDVIDGEIRWLKKTFDMDTIAADSDLLTLANVVQHLAGQLQLAIRATKARISESSTKKEMKAKFFHISQALGGLSKGEAKIVAKKAALAKRYDFKKNLDKRIDEYLAKYKAAMAKVLPLVARDYQAARAMAAGGNVLYAQIANYHLQRGDLLKSKFKVITDRTGKSVGEVNG